ncbi:MAG: hypothetical protein GX804_02605, partial [Lentisphaerae bacterium]|nr:hypothetical protein [Lentisphaerota bacterium]
MNLRELLTPVPGFQTSINLGYDLNDKEKIRAFIPTSASLEVISDILLSTYPKATQRAHMLVGAYGRGKSHIVLVLLALLRMRNQGGLFDTVLARLQEHDAETACFITDNLNGKRKLLPIVVRGSSATLSQAFLSALQVSLAEAGLERLLPPTHFKAAQDAIEKWRTDYPST